jgi:membrane protease YdiL (CAAX protease family)
MRVVFINPQGQLRSGWKALLFILTFGIALAPLVVPFGSFRLVTRLPAWMGLGWISATLLVFITLFFLRVEGRTFASSGLLPNLRWGKEFLLGSILGTSLILIAAGLTWASGAVQLHRTPDVGVIHLLAGALFFLLAAITEEILFRGYPFQRIVEGIGQWPTLLLFALLFTTTHWANPHMGGMTKLWASLNLGLAALLLGLSYLKTKRLALPIGIHLGWNWAQGSLLGFGVSGHQAKGFFQPISQGKAQWLSGGEFGLEASFPGVLVCALFVLALVLWRPHETR